TFSAREDSEMLNMNMDTLSKLAAPATVKIRQLQKIVLDIKKNDGSLLNKLRRLKSKPSPKVPARDYRDARRDDDEFSDLDDDNDMYEDPREDQDCRNFSFPNQSHNTQRAPEWCSMQSLTPRFCFSFPDDHRNRPCRPPRKPLRPGKGSKQLPPEPTQLASDEVNKLPIQTLPQTMLRLREFCHTLYIAEFIFKEKMSLLQEDYVNPNCSNDDDNYVEPEEDPSPVPKEAVSVARGPGPDRRGKGAQTAYVKDFYEVPDKKVRFKYLLQENSLSLPTSRIQEPAEDDEYEVCNPADSSKDKPADGPSLPRSLFRESCRTLPAMQSDQKPPPKAFTLDMKWPKHGQPRSDRNTKTTITMITFVSPVVPGPADKGSVSADNGSTDQDKVRSCNSSVVKDSDIGKQPWYAGACDRRTADNALCRSNKGGAFMVRKSSGQDAQQPYTLVVFYNGRVYNIPIRFIPTTQQYALGREKRGEEHFSSVSQIIENHQRTPLVLIDSQSNAKDATKLRFPSRP
uniref:B cell linker n=1 Tax=Gasterosteus aculeatus TaxID=69293 RepID=G3NER6_GASAC